MIIKLSNLRTPKIPPISLKNGPLICLVLLILFSIAMMTLTGPVFAEENKTLNPQSSSNKAANLAPWPRLLVDQDIVDFGDVPFGKMLEYTFNLKNSGAQPLNIMGTPEVKTLVGC
ncbi:MAG: hypothetical protein HY730_04815 [Candidatus Tectomicrobia bacterium]|uniref:DUF1573 domain-containing protein n=1 Tax=Tectimicrobiota bacterium TaxID=2528274 RepID=A0A933GKS4_UNCTE|nr:hypothetical protein [Candidatus Tectomicrobia bacterium]